MIAGLAGVVPPIVTPLGADGDLDRPALGRIVDRMLDAGAHGVFVLGSCGEGATLSDAVRRQTIEAAVERAGGRGPVLVGAIDTATDRIIAQARIAAALGADGIVATAPLYYRTFHHDEIRAHFARLSDAVALPMLVYNIPSAAQPLLPETLVALAEVAHVVGVKDSSGDWQAFQRLLALRRERRARLALFQGAEDLAAVSVMMGADGLVPGIANLAPRLVVELYQAAAAADVRAAGELQQRVSALCAVYGERSWLRALKGACMMIGLCGARTSLPIPEVEPEEVERIRPILQAHDLIGELTRL